MEVPLSHLQDPWEVIACASRTGIAMRRPQPYLDHIKQLTRLPTGSSLPALEPHNTSGRTTSQLLPTTSQPPQPPPTSHLRNGFSPGVARRRRRPRPSRPSATPCRSASSSSLSTGAATSDRDLFSWKKMTASGRSMHKRCQEGGHPFDGKDWNGSEGGEASVGHVWNPW